jgi:hypothetical protein
MTDISYSRSIQEYGNYARMIAEAWNTRNPDVLLSFLTEDVFWDDPAMEEPACGHDAVNSPFPYGVLFLILNIFLQGNHSYPSTALRLSSPGKFQVQCLVLLIRQDLLPREEGLKSTDLILWNFVMANYAIVLLASTEWDWLSSSDFSHIILSPVL